MDGIFPGVGLFFGILLVIGILAVVFAVVGIPFLPAVIGVAFLGWIVWGIVALVASGMRKG